MKREEELHRTWQAMMAERKINVSFDTFLTIIDVADRNPKYNQEQLMQELNDLQSAYDFKCAEVEQLRNPWRDAKTDPPKEGQEVFAHVPNLCSGEYCKLTYLGNYRWSQDEGEWTTEFYNNEVLWMPIPSVKGGEI